MGTRGRKLWFICLILTLEKDVILKPKTSALIPTGLSIAVEEGLKFKLDQDQV